jgi:hypothetical protein
MFAWPCGGIAQPGKKTWQKRPAPLMVARKQRETEEARGQHSLQGHPQHPTSSHQAPTPEGSTTSHSTSQAGVLELKLAHSTEPSGFLF